MEVERYKMIYTKKINEELKLKLPYIIRNIIDEENKSDNIRLLGKDFLKNNKNKGKLIINNKKYELKEFININEIKGDKIKIYMILSKELSNISHIFYNCKKLKAFYFCDDTRFIDHKGPHLIEEYNDYDNDIYYDFKENSHDNNNEHSLYKNIRTDDIYSNYSEIITKTEEKYNNSTINYIIDKIIIYQHNYYYDMSDMFSGCWSLSSLPAISKWNTNNVTNMSGMFSYYSSLSSLPDISKWNTNNVKDMSNMFSGCSSLSSLPDISKWNTNNVNNMSRMFYNCILILYIPNLE